MCGGAAEGVFCLEYGVGDELAGVLVLEAVHDPGSVLAGGNHPSQAHFGQVLGHCRRGLAHGFGQRADGHFAVPERQDDPDPGGVGQHGEHLHGELDILAVRSQSAHLLICIHMHILARCGFLASIRVGLCFDCFDEFRAVVDDLAPAKGVYATDAGTGA